MNIYNHLDYRIILKKLVKERQINDVSFTYAILAKHIGVQKTYLSKVINGSAEFNTDQLFMANKFFQLNDEETKFMELLLERSRTAMMVRRKQLEQELLKIQLYHLDTKRQLTVENNSVKSSDELAPYYLDPYNLIVHTFLGIPKFQKNSELIRLQLGLAPVHFKQIIENLERLSIIEWQQKSQSYRLLKELIQLAKDSPLLEAHQSLMRNLGFSQLLKIPKNKKFNFQVTFSGNEKTRALIHEKFIEFLQAVEIAVKSAQPEEIYQMGFDLFPWT